ncbi:MAG: hypothetical protein PCFJNLEI_03087 [Verrucomicrobiae bacterium]|nr:hypothetical protein [Verrucomicrobiae bacterium]
MNKYVLILSIAAILAIPPAQANTTLTAGDISLLSLYADSPDAFSFVTWLDLTAGTTIGFTDRGWTGTELLAGEGSMTWSNDTGTTIIAGTAIIVTNLNVTAIYTDLGNIVKASSPDFAVAGDQLLAYQATGFTTNFLFALDMTAGWEPAASTGTGALPLGLTDFSTAILLGTNTWAGDSSIDNSRYVGPRTGLTIAQYKTAITTPSNWEFSDDRFVGSPSSVDFVIIPEPSTWLLVGAGLFGAILLRRRRR